MGVDHGLGGKDSAKSKLRRDKKARRAKNIAKSLRSDDAVHSSKEVKFDDAARVAWLTGFRQRKQERRKYGIAMQLMKDKKARKDLARHKKKVMLEQNEELLEAQRAAESLSGVYGEDSEEMAASNALAEKEETLFEDKATQDMFGSSVSVTVQSTLDDAWFDNQHQHQLSDEEGDEEDEEDDDDDKTAGGRSVASATSRERRRGKPELSNFDRAMKKASTLMNNPKKRNRDAYKRNASREVKKKIDSSKLLDKALGRMHGKGKGQARGGRSKGRR